MEINLILSEKTVSCWGHCLWLGSAEQDPAWEFWMQQAIESKYKREGHFGETEGEKSRGNALLWEASARMISTRSACCGRMAQAQRVWGTQFAGSS